MLETPATIDVPLRTDADGVLRVGNTRVTFKVIIAAYNHGDTPEEIAEGFDTLKLEQIYAVITYYLSHKEEADRYIQRANEEAERFRQAYEAENPQSAEFYAKMRALRDEKRRQDQS